MFLQLIKSSLWRYNFILSQHNIHNNEIEFIRELIDSIGAAMVFLTHKTQKLILDTIYREIVLFYHCNMNQTLKFPPELLSYENINKILTGKVNKRQMYYLVYSLKNS